MKSKICESFDAAVADIPDGVTIMMHSFNGPSGIAQNLILALRRQGAKNLVIIACSTGVGTGLQQKLSLRPFVTPNILVESGQVRRAVTTWAVRARGTSTRGTTEINPLEEAIKRGEVEWIPVSQGVLAEQIRAGATGLGGFYSPVGVSTIIEKGKEKSVIDGKEHLFYPALHADYAFVKAYKADKIGNLIYRGTERSYNPLMAMAASVTIVEAEHIVEVGEIDPEHVITPGVFVDRIVPIPKKGGE